MTLNNIFYQVISRNDKGTAISVPEGDVLQNVLSLVHDEVALTKYLKEYCTKHYNMNHNDIISVDDVNFVSFEISCGNYAIKK